MARVVKVFRTLRNHWKKSTFAVCVLSYGGHWLYGKHNDNVLRREACIEARAFGHQLIGPQEHLKKATVILNPAACKGKANRLFEKNAAPILHLAGMEVKIVKTDYEGQAKKLMELMDQTDMLIIAGGDGTLQEVITGLLRRADEETFSKIPIAFIPLGCSNSLSQSLHLDSNNKAHYLSNPVNTERRNCSTGCSADKNNYWYLGPLKTRAAHWFSCLKQWPQTQQTSLSYLAPVPRPPDLPTEIPPRPNLLYRIYRRLQNYWNTPIQEPPKDPEPERWENKDISTLELTVSTHNKNPVKRVNTDLIVALYGNENVIGFVLIGVVYCLQREADSMLITLDPDSLTAGQFITEGTKKALNPMESVENALQIEASAACLSLPEEGVGFYDIDNEAYEAMSVEVRLLPRKLRFFCSAEHREQLAQAQ